MLLLLPPDIQITILAHLDQEARAQLSQACWAAYRAVLAQELIEKVTVRVRRLASFDAWLRRRRHEGGGPIRAVVVRDEDDGDRSGLASVVSSLSDHGVQELGLHTCESWDDWESWDDSGMSDTLPGIFAAVLTARSLRSLSMTLDLHTSPHLSALMGLCQLQRLDICLLLPEEAEPVVWTPQLPALRQLLVRLSGQGQFVVCLDRLPALASLTASRNCNTWFTAGAPLRALSELALVDPIDLRVPWAQLRHSLRELSLLGESDFFISEEGTLGGVTTLRGLQLLTMDLTNPLMGFLSLPPGEWLEGVTQLQLRGFEMRPPSDLSWFPTQALRSLTLEMVDRGAEVRKTVGYAMEEVAAWARCAARSACLQEIKLVLHGSLLEPECRACQLICRAERGEGGQPGDVATSLLGQLDGWLERSGFYTLRPRRPRVVADC